MDNWQQKIKSVWRRRSERNGVAKVMSTRYPPEANEEEADRYVQAVMEFIGSDLDGKDVLEIGSGIGLLTKQLLKREAKITCIEVEQKMIDESKRLIPNTEQITYLNILAQDYVPQPHDAVVCARVLTHNVEHEAFVSLAQVIAACAPMIFLIELTDPSFQQSPESIARSKTALANAFPGYHITREGPYVLAGDEYAFLRLER